MIQTKTGMQLAVEAAGSQLALAKALGMSPVSVNNWVRQGWAPTKHVVEIERRYGVPRITLLNPRITAALLPGD